MEVGNRIKQVRKELKMSQYQLAKSIKFLNQSQLSKIENGKRELKADELIKISKALNIPLEKLIS